MLEPNQRTALNRGWLHVERSMSDQLDHYVTENALSFAGGWLEVRRFGWREAAENVWATDRRCYLLNMSLSPRPAASEVRNLSSRRPGAAVGRTFLVPPGQTMRCRNAGKGKTRSLRCAIGAELVESFLNEPPGDDWTDSLNLNSGEIEWLLRRMYRELQQPDFVTVAVIEALAKQLAAEIVRQLKPRCADASYHLGGLAPWRMKLIRDRLYCHRELPALAELAELCGMTVRHLTRAFRTETGRTLGHAIEAAMVERALGRLDDGAPIGAIARELGYASSSSFAAAFRRATGLAPGEVKLSRSSA